MENKVLLSIYTVEDYSRRQKSERRADKKKPLFLIVYKLSIFRYICEEDRLSYARIERGREREGETRRRKKRREEKKKIRT